MSSKLVIANFKSNKTREEYETWMNEFEKQSNNISHDVKIVLAPTSTDLMFFANRLLDKKLHPQSVLGIQDLSCFPAGAYTGAVSTRNLEGFDVQYAIVGHSERRRYFHETDLEIAGKVRQAHMAHILPIVCVTKATIVSQANAIEPQDRSNLLVAFEPIDHIGTGIADSLEDILAAHTLVKEAFGTPQFLYGGSVDAHSDRNLLTHPDIDGFLVGSACLDAGAFSKLIHSVR